MNMHLKIKICTLQAESKIIRSHQRKLIKRIGPPPSIIKSTPPHQEEAMKLIAENRLERKRQKAKLAVIKMGTKPLHLWPTLQQHRRGIVRKSSRHALLAYAFLRNREYAQLERKCYEAPDWKEIEKLIRRFTMERDLRIVLQRFEEWSQRGKQVQAGYKEGAQAPQSSGDQTRISA